jgi:anaerobic dimethyl sulfoxide reductase subunit B (iron-sulfur subunit)
LACPYEAPVYDKKSGQLDKCDFCQERLDEGLQPYCVAACPMRALSLSWEWDEKLDCEHPAPLPAKRLLGPRLMIIAHPIIAQKLKGAKNKEPIEIVKANPEEI